MSTRATQTLHTGRTIPQFALGVYAIHADQTADAVQDAFQVGYRHVDTARVYGNEKESAQGVAKFLKEHPEVSRKDVYFTTKIWSHEFEYNTAMNAIQNSVNNTKEIEYIDLFLVHTPASTKQKRLEVYRALQDSVDKGFIKDIGVSNYGIAHLQELLDWDGLRYKPVVNQIEINPWLQRNKEVEFCRQHDILVESYSPLMLGRRFHEPQLLKLAHKYKCSAAQILLKWNLQKGYIPLPKSGNPQRIRENFNLDGIELADSEVESLGDSNEHFMAAGGPDPLQS